MHRCHYAFLFKLPKGYPATGKLFGSSVALGKRLGRVIPMLLCTPMVPFWPFTSPQPTAGPDKENPHTLIPTALQGHTLGDYADADMQKCGRLLRHHTNVKAWIAPKAGAVEVLPWYQVDMKVHMDCGYLHRDDWEPGFWWEFELGKW